MSNWLGHDYILRGSEDTLRKIHSDIVEVAKEHKDDIAGGAVKYYKWVSQWLVCNKLGVPNEKLQSENPGYDTYIRGFIFPDVEYHGGDLKLQCCEAWSETIFGKVLQEKFPEITIEHKYDYSDMY